MRGKAREMGVVRDASTAEEKVRGLAGGAGSPGRTILRAKFPANRENNRDFGSFDAKRSVRIAGPAGEFSISESCYPFLEQVLFPRTANIEAVKREFGGPARGPFS